MRYDFTDSRCFLLNIHSTVMLNMEFAALLTFFIPLKFDMLYTYIHRSCPTLQIYYCIKFDLLYLYIWKLPHC